MRERDLSYCGEQNANGFPHRRRGALTNDTRPLPRDGTDISKSWTGWADMRPS